MSYTLQDIIDTFPCVETKSEAKMVAELIREITEEQIKERLPF